MLHLRILRFSGYFRKLATFFLSGMIFIIVYLSVATEISRFEFIVILHNNIYNNNNRTIRDAKVKNKNCSRKGQAMTNTEIYR